MCQYCGEKDGQIGKALNLERENLISEKGVMQSHHDLEMKKGREEHKLLHRELEQSKNKSKFMETHCAFLYYVSIHLLQSSLRKSVAIECFLLTP